MDAMEEVPVHGANKIPHWSGRLLLPTALETYVEKCVLGQLTWQWMDLGIRELRYRQGRLRERWASVGLFKIWFDAWMLLEDSVKLRVLEQTLRFDRQFGLSMLQAVYLHQRGPLDSLD